MSLASVTIDRSDMAGTPAPLVISDDSSDYRLTENGMGYVVQSVRMTTAPPSRFVDGEVVTGYAREATELPLEFYVIGTSSADVATKVAAMEEALYRLGYPVTRMVDGVSVAYSGGPCALKPVRAAVDSGVLAQHFDTFAVTIPLPNPNGSAVDEES